MSPARTMLGLLLEVRPLPMAGAMLTALLGMAWAQGGLSPFSPAGLSLLACVFFGLYTAHLSDSCVDVVWRGDRTPGDFPLVFRDSSGLIADGIYPPLIGVSAAACAAFAVAPVVAGGPAVALFLGAGLFLSLTYSPFLDRTLVGVSFGYPLGAGAVLAAGYLVAGGHLDARLAALRFPLVLALVGTKMRSDVIDVTSDAAIGKRTLPVLLGERRAVRIGYLLCFAALLATATLPLAVAASPAFSVPPVLAAVAIALASRKSPLRSSMAMAYALVFMLAAEVILVGFAGAGPPA